MGKVKKVKSNGGKGEDMLIFLNFKINKFCVKAYLILMVLSENFYWESPYLI